MKNRAIFFFCIKLEAELAKIKIYIYIYTIRNCLFAVLILGWSLTAQDGSNPWRCSMQRFVNKDKHSSRYWFNISTVV